MGLENGDFGEPLLPKGYYLMESKVMGAAPLWFTEILSDLCIYPISFSKYGNVYKKEHGAFHFEEMMVHRNEKLGCDKEETGMLNSIFHAGTFYAESVAAAMATAAILGLMIALLYKRSGSSVHLGSFCGHSGDPAASVSVVIMIVNGNLGTSVAVLGAFGLVRFRSAPRYGPRNRFYFLCHGCGAGSRYGLLSLAVLLYAGHWDDVLVLENCILTVTIPENVSFVSRYRKI